MRYLLALLMVVGTGSPDPIRLRVTPHSTFGPATIRADVSIEPNYLNSTLCLLWGSENGSTGSSCQSIPGQYAPKTNTYFVPLTPGDYTFEARVYQGQKWIVSQHEIVNVLSHQ